ncbi:hypothetical protein Mal35_16540 [Gimesia maris]|nr:hypothetical protein Mal35_16540 [Gimesia maris]
MLARTIQHARQKLNRHNFACTLTLLACAASSAGLPTQLSGQPTSGCQCGEGLMAAGQCCCIKAQRSSSSPACCEKKVTCCSKEKSQPKSCCGTVAKSCCRSKPDSSDSKTPAISACGCGGGPSEAVLLTTAEPRILLNVAGISTYGDSVRWFPASELESPSHFTSPETPPPEVHLSCSSPA